MNKNPATELKEYLNRQNIPYDPAIIAEWKKYCDTIVINKSLTPEECNEVFRTWRTNTNDPGLKVLPKPFQCTQCGGLDGEHVIGCN